MNLNNIRLPASVLASLYRSSLIDTNDGTSEVFSIPGPADVIINDTKGTPGKYLGENKKNILIVVDHNDVVHLPDDDLVFLTNMLAACKLSLADVVIVNRNNYKEGGYKKLIMHFKSRIIFLFGIEPVSFGLPLSFPHFQIQPFASATFLFVPALEDHKKDELLKSKLWVCLRRIFAI